MARIKDSIKKYSREIIVGVIVSILTTIVIKAWDWIIDIAPQVGSNIIETIDNLTYSFAAQMSSITLLWISFSCVSSAFLGFIISTISRGFETYIETRKLEKEVKKMTDEQIEAAELSLYKQDITTTHTNYIKDSISHGKRVGKSALFCTILLFIVYVMINTFVLQPSHLREKFTQDITIITPYVECGVVQKLESDWILMRNRDDYEAIYEIVDNIKEQNDLKNNK